MKNKALCLFSTLVFVLLSSIEIARSGDIDDAARLVAVGAFVSNACPDLRVNNTAFAAALVKTGVSTDELKSDAVSQKSQILIEKLLKSRRPACTAALITFGPNGTDEQGLVSPK